MKDLFDFVILQLTRLSDESTILFTIRRWSISMFIDEVLMKRKFSSICGKSLTVSNSFYTGKITSNVCSHPSWRSELLPNHRKTNLWHHKSSRYVFKMISNITRFHKRNQVNDHDSRDASPDRKVQITNWREYNYPSCYRKREAQSPESRVIDSPRRLVINLLMFVEFKFVFVFWYASRHIDSCPNSNRNLIGYLIGWKRLS